MKMRQWIALLLGVCAIVATVNGQTGTAQEMLEAARKAAVLDGDCTAAIKQYQAIVTRFEKTDRAVAARALLGMAECYEKTGNSQDAQRTYARVIKEYGDQAGAVAEARAAIVPPPATGQGDRSRLVWTLPSADTWVRGNVSADGRYLAIAAPGGGIMLHDVVTGADRVVARPTPEDPDVWLAAIAFSRDVRKLAYEVNSSINETGRGIRVINLDEPGLPRHRVLINTPALPCDWSPDGQWIVARLPQQTGVVRARQDPMSPWQLALVSTTDGSTRVLKTFTARYRSRHSALFSPDGRHIAFEVPEDDRGPRDVRDIHVVSVDGRSEVRAVARPGDDALVGWSPDGALLFSSSRGSGTPAIWRQSFDSGRVRGEPELVRAQASHWTLGLTASGALVYGVDNGPGVGIKQAAFDTNTGTFQSALEDTPTSWVRSSRRPRWSPDGSQLGYISVRGERGGNVFVQLDMTTGQSRELPGELYFRSDNQNLWFWTPDGRSILTIAEDPDPAVGEGLYRTDLGSGRTSPIVARSFGNIAQRNDLTWSADGRVLQYSYLAGPSRYVRVARDLITGEETEVPPQASPQSPDGSKIYTSRRQPGSVIVVVERDAKTGAERDVIELVGNTDWYLVEKGTAIVAITTDLATSQDVALHYTLATGVRREVFRAQRGQPVSITTLTPDQRSFIVQFKPREGATSQFWWVATDGRPSRLLKELTDFEDVSWDFHPDGRRVALQVNYPRTINDQIYVLENFLPSARR